MRRVENRCATSTAPLFNLLIWKPVKTGSESTTSWSTWSHSEPISRQDEPKVCKVVKRIIFGQSENSNWPEKKFYQHRVPPGRKKTLEPNQKTIDWWHSLFLSLFLLRSFFLSRSFLSGTSFLFRSYSFSSFPSLFLKKNFFSIFFYFGLPIKKLWFGFSWFCFKKKVFVAGVRDWIQFLFLMLPSSRWFVVAQKCCYLSFQGQQLFHSFYIWQSGRVLFLAI